MRFRPAPIVLALLALLALAVLFVAPVWAHALLVRSIPEANAALARAPAQVELFFSEALEPSFSSVTVYSSDGTQVDNNDSRVDAADATHLTVSLRSLADGVYTVSWKSISSVDSHLTAGAFPFAVGDVDAAALAEVGQASRQISLSLGEVIAKWLAYVSAAVLAGGALFVLVVWQPAYRAMATDAAQPGSPPWPRVANVALITLMLANLMALLVQAGRASGSEIAAPWSAAVNGVLFTTRYGALWIARVTLTFALAGLLATAVPRRRLVLGVSLLLLLSISLGSHAAAEVQPGLPVLADWLHLVAASVWIGGLIHFAVGLWAVRGQAGRLRTQLAAGLIPRFSALALFSVGTLVLSGLYSVILRVGTFEALIGTLYGRALLVKLVMALCMVMLGAVNLLIVSPGMRRAAVRANGDAGLVTRFHRIVASEVTLGAALLLSVGVLTSLPPAQISSTPPALTASAHADDLDIAIDITPGRVGVNTFTLNVSANGRPIENARAVELRFAPVALNVPPSQAQLAGLGGGRYSTKGAYLSLPGRWQVQAVVRREDRFDAFAEFNFEVGATGAAPSFAWSQAAGILLVVAALVYAYALGSRSRGRVQLAVVGFAPALALIAVGYAVFNTPSGQNADLVNPIPPNAASVDAGRAIYQEMCVPCHGVAGKGDGPVGLTLNPRPADLTLHAVPGVHTDGQLYEWITGGFPGSVMPAFKDRLSDDDRWNAVNFIRTLAPK